MLMGHPNFATAPVRTVTNPSTNWASDCLTSVINHKIFTPSYRLRDLPRKGILAEMTDGLGLTCR